MALQPGERLGQYEIAAVIGAGGMGEVYRARDTRLKRDIALKILPASVVSEPDRVFRFQREAELLAALNHPNIASIYGIEEADSFLALVMELVDGEDLSARIARGPMPVDEALPIARQMADALDAAHERGIVHRDLKPANIKVRPDGTVKVLDFGIAKSLDRTAGSVTTTGAHAVTFTTPSSVTSAGLIVGTAAYMSPEQARGKPVDKGADIWAFGVVLWEMLSGRQLFAGDTLSDTLAAVLREDPTWDAIAESLRPVLRLCLQKEPRQRLRDIGDVRMLLDQAVADAATAPAGTAPGRGAVWRLLAAIGTTAVLASVLVAIAMSRSTPTAPAALVQLSLSHPPPEVVGGNDFDDNIAISPDGRAVAYVAAATGVNSNVLRLYLRALDRREPALLSETARAPFFSPDGQWIGFVENNARLSKVSSSGGPPVLVGGQANAPRGISWGDDDHIVFATAGVATGLMRIAASGGEPSVLTRPDASKGEVDHVFPDVLPRGRGILFTIIGSTSAPGSHVALFDPTTGTHRVLIRDGTHPKYVAPGYIVYAHAGVLRAVAFDAERLEVAGTSVPVLDRVQTRPSGAASFGIAANGTLAYIERGAAEDTRTLSWIDREGRETPLALAPGYYDSFALSRDGMNVAMTRRNADGQSDIWVWSHERRTFSRLTFEPGTHEGPLWSHDGQSIAYTTCRVGCTLSLRRADGAGTPAPLLNADTAVHRAQMFASAWTPDGRLLFEEQRLGGSWESKSVTLSETREEAALFGDTPFREAAPTVSPDGRWLTYVSNESGGPKVYVRPFPNLNAGKWQVSVDAATTPRWSSDGRLLYFVDSSNPSDPAVAVVDVQTGPAFSFSRPRRLVTLPAALRGVSLVRSFGGEFEVSSDGQQFLFVRSGGGPARPSLNVVLNWTTELVRLIERE